MKNIIFLMLLSSQAQAAIEDTSLRYLSGHEIPAKLASVYTQAMNQVSSVQACNITDSNAAATGMVIPGVGKSIYNEPSGAFLNWYLPCITAVVEQDLLRTADANYQPHLGPLAGKAETVAKQSLKMPYQVPANTFTPQEYTSLVRYQVERLLGPDEVIEEMGLVTSAQDLREALFQFIQADSQLSVLEIRAVIKKLEIEILSRDEFLIY